MHSIHDLRILRDRMHTGLDGWGYGRIDLRYAHECHPAAVMRAHQRMAEELTGLQQPIKYWFGEMQPLTSGGVMHHLACIDRLIETLQRREEQMRRAAVGEVGGRVSRAEMVFRGLLAGCAEESQATQGEGRRVPRLAPTPISEPGEVQKIGPESVAIETDAPEPAEEQGATRPAHLHEDEWYPMSTTEEEKRVSTHGEGLNGAQNCAPDGATADWDLCG
ncbi:MAG: hypothetical protein Q9207_006451 [Kuettlingeria erythrocarpa]